jgi:hypothetical protein
MFVHRHANVLTGRRLSTANAMLDATTVAINHCQPSLS